MNEAGNITPLIDEIVCLKGAWFEIIYIDDASTDDTAVELYALLTIVPQCGCCVMPQDRDRARQSGRAYGRRG